MRPQIPVPSPLITRRLLSKPSVWRRAFLKAKDWLTSSRPTPQFASPSTLPVLWMSTGRGHQPHILASRLRESPEVALKVAR